MRGVFRAANYYVTYMSYYTCAILASVQHVQWPKVGQTKSLINSPCWYKGWKSMAGILVGPLFQDWAMKINIDTLGILSIQCVPEKRKPINRVNFSENCNDLSEKVYIVTNFSLSSFFWHQLYMYWPCLNKHGPFQMVMSKMICAEWEFKGLTGSAMFQNKGTPLGKTFISISFVSFVMFLLLRLLILTCISESRNLGISTQHHYSAQIVFDMHKFK